MLRISLLIVALAFPLPAYAWPGTVLDVHDGDTMTVAPMGDVRTPLKIRLYGIDAPELEQKGGPQSRDHLLSLVRPGCVCAWMYLLFTSILYRTINIKSSAGSSVMQTKRAASVMCLPPFLSIGNSLFLNTFAVYPTRMNYIAFISPKNLFHPFCCTICNKNWTC